MLLPPSQPLPPSHTLPPQHTHIYIYTHNKQLFLLGGGLSIVAAEQVLDNSLGIDTRGEDCRMLIILLICWAGRDLLLRM